MKRLISAALFAVLPFAAAADDIVGIGRLFTNDALGDGHDRWRTGSYAISVLTAEGREWRWRSEIIAPASLSGPSDRPYVGALSFGLHQHGAEGPVDWRLGADVVTIGPVTQLSRAQDAFHTAIGLGGISPDVAAGQLGDAVHVSISGEAGQTLDAGNATLRPFVEGQFGVEDILRLGLDLSWGAVGEDLTWTRDVVTGQRYPMGESTTPGLLYSLGADFANVSDTLFLPGGALDRTRLRAGVRYQRNDHQSWFYGLTWLSPEFEGQAEGQLLGSIKLVFTF